MSSSKCCFLTCIQISQKVGQVVWYSHLFQNFPQFIVIHTVKGFDIVITFTYLIHFELIFLCGIRWSPASFFCRWLSSFPKPYIEETNVYSCLLCHKLINHLCMGLFLGSLFCSLYSYGKTQMNFLANPIISSSCLDIPLWA